MPAWICWWAWRSEDCMKTLGQILHLKNLSPACVLWQTEVYNGSFSLHTYFHSVSVTSFPVGWPTVFIEGIEFGPCCPEQLRTNMWLLLGTYGNGTVVPFFFLELFWEPLLCPLWVKTSLSRPWNLSILPSAPSSIRPFFNFLLSLRPTSVPFFQEWSLTGEYSVPSVIWHMSLLEGLGFLNKFIHYPWHWPQFLPSECSNLQKKFSPCKVTVVYLLGFFSFLSTSFGSLQFSKPLSLTKTWNSWNHGDPKLFPSPTYLTIFLLVCEPGLSHRWQLRESSQILEGIEFQEGGKSSESNMPSLKVVVLLSNVFFGMSMQTLATLIQGCLGFSMTPWKCLVCGYIYWRIFQYDSEQSLLELELPNWDLSKGFTLVFLSNRFTIYSGISFKILLPSGSLCLGLDLKLCLEFQMSLFI